MAQDREKPILTGQPVTERGYKPTARQNTHDREVEANLPTKLGSTYGFNQHDQPVHPPRRVSSQRSLSHVQSLGSVRSSYSRPTEPSALPALPLPSSPLQLNQMTTTQPIYSQSHDLEQGTNFTGHPSGRNEYPENPEEPPWGPSHPCYPHLNPHVPLQSPLYDSTRIVRIRRDWMVVGDLAPCYSNIYPEILDPLLPEPEFRYIIQHINNTLIKAFDPFRVANWIDGVLGLLTGWFWEDFRPGGVKGELKRLDAWIEEWNRTVGAQDGVKLIGLRRTGYLCLDIQIPDPQVRVIGSDGEGEHNEPMGNNVTPGLGVTV